jgi:Arc/MetJ-type ribon-helix-helix transcriptional regulator
VAAKATSATPRRRWNDDTIETELRAQIAELGHFPTRSELVASGLRGLWDAMRAHGGAEAWAARMNGGRQAPSHEAIAERAYELYDRGAPGDHVDHWLAAEQELRGASR